MMKLLQTTCRPAFPRGRYQPKKTVPMANFKHVFTGLMALLLSQTLVAQDDYKRWAVEIGGGTTVPNMDIKAEPQYYGQGGIRFNLSKLFGLKADYSMGVLKMDGDEGAVENEFFRYGVRGVLNFGEVVKLTSDRYNFLMNAGFGAIHSDIPFSFSTFPDNYMHYDGYLDGEDYSSQDFYTNVGGRVQVKINESFAISLKANYYFSQSDLMDGRAPRRENNQYNDQYLSAGAGISYYFGSGKSHADWAPAQASPAMEKKTDSNRKALEQLRGKLKDSDDDGVIDALDQDNATKDGVRVNAKGEAMDTDYDGIPDFKDDCPVQKGPDSTNGCPQQLTDSVIKQLKQEVKKAARRAPRRRGDTGRRARRDADGRGEGERDARRRDRQRDDAGRDRGRKGDQTQADKDQRRGQGDDAGRRGRRGRQADRGADEQDKQQQRGRQSGSGKSNVDDYQTVTVTSKPADQISTYYIIGGSFSEKANAIDFNDFLQSEGFEAQILFVKDRGLYRVSYESFDSQKAATERLSEIRQKFNDQAWILGN